ncbi:short coiled-coil protein homolog isoform X1 [Eriocheir sinensis]|uniref:short coiled-coil protein homolog isoform X1 n=1 Tax=Eriocheir sinensis TaxID=95602 RepID=UPI0021C9A094|nr:short coiled-coil protein homolog isoform X1 [Eriocheir sinensis]
MEGETEIVLPAWPSGVSVNRAVKKYACQSAMSSYQDDNSIPLVDDDPSVVLDDDRTAASEISNSTRGQSLESIPSTYTNGSSSPLHNSESLSPFTFSGLEPDISPDEHEEKARLIAQVLELQNTLDDLSQRVDSVKEENLKLRSENQVLGQYIENLMSASSVFQSTSPKTKKNKQWRQFEA